MSTFNELSQTRISFNNSGKVQLPNVLSSVIFNLHKDTKCEDFSILRRWDWQALLKPKLWIFTDKNIQIGFGYSEALIRCREDDTTYPSADLLVLNLQFGNTVGVTESFGLFQKRMDALHQEHIEFIKHGFHETINIPALVYYPNPENVGNEDHRRILMTYAEGWTRSSGIIEKRMIIQTPYFEQEIKRNFSVTPYVRQCRFKCPDVLNESQMWYVPSALATISKYFTSVVLSYGK